MIPLSGRAKGNQDKDLVSRGRERGPQKGPVGRDFEELAELWPTLSTEVRASVPLDLLTKLGSGPVSERKADIYRVLLGRKVFGIDDIGGDVRDDFVG